MGLGISGEVRAMIRSKQDIELRAFRKWRTKPFVVYLMVTNDKIIKGGEVWGPI